jgi:hypothetical protein
VDAARVLFRPSHPQAVRPAAAITSANRSRMLFVRDRDRLEGLHLVKKMLMVHRRRRRGSFIQ